MFYHVTIIFIASIQSASVRAWIDSLSYLIFDDLFDEGFHLPVPDYPRWLLPLPSQVVGAELLVSVSKQSIFYNRLVVVLNDTAIDRQLPADVIGIGKDRN